MSEQQFTPRKFLISTAVENRAREPVITGSILSIIPLVVAFLFLQRYWQSGLATGGVKA
jgi:ABC-type maltose transport system permease subunit